MFGSFKKKLKEHFREWNLDHPTETITKNNICSLTKQPFLSSHTPDNIISAFEAAGIIIPFNPTRLTSRIPEAYQEEYKQEAENLLQEVS